MPLFLLAAIFVAISAARDVRASDPSGLWDSLRCEDALTHVEACCPALDAPEDACVYEDDSDDTPHCACAAYHGTVRGSGRTPVFPRYRSQELVALSCEEIARDDGCATLEVEVHRDTRWVVEKTEGSCY